MNYEQRYKEALNKAKDLYGKYCINNILEDLFPELKESKDERIRKTIYGWIYTQPSRFFDNGFSKEEMLAWVEKQGDNKKLDADKVIEWLKNTISETKEYFGGYGVYCNNTRLTLPYNSVEDLINDFKEDFGL